MIVSEDISQFCCMNSTSHQSGLRISYIITVFSAGFALYLLWRDIGEIGLEREKEEKKADRVVFEKIFESV